MSSTVECSRCEDGECFACRQRCMPSGLSDDGWIAISRWNYLWCHPPSNRCVYIRQAHGSEMFSVDCYEADEGGEPIRGESIDDLTFAEAIRHGRVVRRSILDERRDVTIVEQGELFDDAKTGAA